LSAGVDRINLPLVDFHWNAAKGSYGVDNKHRPRIADGGSNLFNRLPRAGRSFGHHDCYNLRLHASKRVFHFDQVEHFAPRPFNFGYFAAGPFRHIGKSIAKHAVDADQHALARFHQIENRGFLPGGARAADRHRHAVFRSKHLTEHELQFVHDAEIIWVQMADRWLCKRGQHARMDIARPRTKQRANRCGKRRRNLGHIETS
jgi:hypothetical protein